MRYRMHVCSTLVDNTKEFSHVILLNKISISPDVVPLTEKGQDQHDVLGGWIQLQCMRWFRCCHTAIHFTGSASGKEPTCQYRRHKRHRFHPWVRKLPRGGTGNPLQYCCLETPTDRGACWAIVHRIAQSRTQLKWLSTHTHLLQYGKGKRQELRWKIRPWTWKRGKPRREIRHTREIAWRVFGNESKCKNKVLMLGHGETEVSREPELAEFRV